MAKQVNRNIILSSTLIFIAAGLVVVSFLAENFTAITGDTFKLNVAIFDGLFHLIVLSVLAYLIRCGFVWAKWAFGVYFVWGIYGLIWFLPIILQIDMIAGAIAILQTLLQVIALILLFVKPKQVATIS